MSAASGTAALFVGIATLDLAYLVDSYPVEDTKNRASDVFMGAGGPATNAAVTFAFLAGGGARLLTALGAHPLSDVVRDDLDRHSVALEDRLPEHQKPPPVSSIIVVRTNGSRTIVSLDASRIPAVDTALPSGFLTDLDAVLVDGHLMDLSVAVARASRSANIPVILDAGRWKPGNEELLRYIDIAICSRSFVPPAIETEEPFAAHGYLLEQGVLMAATTDGANPITYSTATDKGEVDVPFTNVVDTLGAGDVFHGAFSYYYARRRHRFVEALAKAAAVASGSCASFGTRAWMNRGRVAYPA